MIAIASDHAGYNLKEQVKAYLENVQIEYKDFGTSNTDSCHYVDFAQLLAQAVADGEYEKGILICGTGVGMSIAANKIKGIRAVCCSDNFSARASREHNDANILCFGERVVGAGVAYELVHEFLTAEFQGGRHKVRVDMIGMLENI